MTMRSWAGISCPSAFRSVVFPDDVRPAIRMFFPARTQAAEECCCFAAEEPELLKFGE